MSHGFEAQLLRWAETSNGGATIVLQLSDPGDLEHFKSMTLAKKGMVGQRLMVGVAEIGDDERPVDSQWTVEERATLETQGAQPIEINKLKGGELARLAGIWCGNPDFQVWLHARFVENPILIRGAEDEQTAELLRRVCEVKSRAELDHNPTAREYFDNEIRIPYSQYLKENA